MKMGISAGEAKYPFAKVLQSGRQAETSDLLVVLCRTPALLHTFE